RNAVRPLQALGPDSGREAVVGAVGVLNDFFFRVERSERNNRAEDFFGVGAAVVGQAFDDGRGDEPAVLATSFDLHLVSARQDGAALLPGQLDVGKYLLY